MAGTASTQEDGSSSADKPGAAGLSCVRLLWQVACLLLEHGASLSPVEVDALDQAMLRLTRHADEWTLALLGTVLADVPHAPTETLRLLAPFRLAAAGVQVPGSSSSSNPGLGLALAQPQFLTLAFRDDGVALVPAA